MTYSNTSGKLSPAPRVSVVTPAYNAEETIQRCVESVRNQTFQNWEQIIVDDGSTDRTWQLLQELSQDDPRLQIIQQENQGQGPARNTAILAAEGEFIALLDADDWCVPDRLEQQVTFFDNHPDVDVLGGGIINVPDNGQRTSRKFYPSRHEQLAEEIFQRTPFATSTVMARRTFFLDLGLFREIRRVEDIDLWLRSYRDFRFHNLQVPLVYYLRSSQPNIKHALRSARVRLEAIRREQLPWYYAWFAVRLVGANLLWKAGLYQPELDA